MFTLPKEFLDWPIPGPKETENLVSLSAFKEEEIYYTSGCFGKQLNQILGSDKLPILLPTYELARLIMIKSHNFAHMSASDTAARSCLESWIVCARPLTRKITNGCLECRRKYKVFLSQREGKLLKEKMYIGHPPFTLTAINFQMKVWPVVFACLNTGAFHIELNKNYGTDALLLSITSFTSIRGYPAKFYTDKGTQLSKADYFINSKENPGNWT